jgi:hypothetical protein
VAICIFYGHLVYIFFPFGMLRQGKSGSPGCRRCFQLPEDVHATFAELIRRRQKTLRRQQQKMERGNGRQDQQQKNLK